MPRSGNSYRGSRNGLSDVEIVHVQMIIVDSIDVAREKEMFVNPLGQERKNDWWPLQLNRWRDQRPTSHDMLPLEFITAFDC